MDMPIEMKYPDTRLDIGGGAIVQLASLMVVTADAVLGLLLFFEINLVEDSFESPTDLLG